MSKLYGTLEGSLSKTKVTRRGSRYIKTSAQSYEGSVITEMKYDDNERLIVSLELSDESSTKGTSIFEGTLEELKEKLMQ